MVSVKLWIHFGSVWCLLSVPKSTLLMYSWCQSLKSDIAVWLHVYLVPKEDLDNWNSLIWRHTCQSWLVASWPHVAPPESELKSWIMEIQFWPSNLKLVTDPLPNWYPILIHLYWPGGQNGKQVKGVVNILRVLAASGRVPLAGYGAFVSFLLLHNVLSSCSQVTKETEIEGCSVLQGQSGEQETDQMQGIGNRAPFHSWQYHTTGPIPTALIQKGSSEAAEMWPVSGHSRHLHPCDHGWRVQGRGSWALPKRPTSITNLLSTRGLLRAAAILRGPPGVTKSGHGGVCTWYIHSAVSFSAIRHTSQKREEGHCKAATETSQECMPSRMHLCMLCGNE